MPFLSNVQYSELPPTEEKYYADMMKQANEARESKADVYADEHGVQQDRLAPFPEDLRSSQDNVRLGFGSEREMFNGAERAIGRSARPFHENVRDYMNPYQQHVVRQLAEEGNRNFTENILPALEARFVRLGQHGGSRHADLSLRAARDFQRELLGRQQQAMASGYQQAGQMYNAQQLRELEGAGQLSNLATTRQGSRYADIASLEGMGKYQQQQDQAALDIRYQDWLRQKEHPMLRLQQQAALMNGMPYQGMNQSFYQTPAPQQMNLAGQLGPLAIGLLGTRMMGGRG